MLATTTTTTTTTTTLHVVSLPIKQKLHQLFTRSPSVNRPGERAKSSAAIYRNGNKTSTGRKGEGEEERNRKKRR